MFERHKSADTIWSEATAVAEFKKLAAFGN
jgi:hypothetical protein